MVAPSQEASLKTIFMQKNDGFKFKVKVKILKAISSTNFLVADSTGSCKLKIDNLKPIYMGSYKEIILWEYSMSRPIWLKSI